MSAQTYEFKTEAQQLLDLMIHSLYSTKEIFLRELISNASDALDKLRFEALTVEGLIEREPLEIKIEADAEARTLTIDDNGIGMSREEIIENLGTIAHSGTKAFSEKLAELKAESSPESLIGQFGVGFYSAFMVASEITVISRRAGTTEATRWTSRGDGQFEVDEAERSDHGTRITLKLRDTDEDNGLADFTAEYTLRQIIKKYSDFVTWPIALKIERQEPIGGAEDEGEDEDETPPETETVVKWEVINSQKAIWTRNPSEVTAEEYAEFYKHISMDWEAPFETISFKSEGTFEYHSLLFIPDRPPFDLFYREHKYGLRLYVNRVLIMENNEELLPDWLRFIKGVVDSPDLSLNVSREILQKDRRVSSIQARVIKKVIDTLSKMHKEERDRYISFWEKYGRVLKEGTTDYKHADKLKGLLLFQSSHHDSELTSLAEYIERMKPEQEDIYFITGESRAAVERSPHLEAFRDKEIEVLYLIDPVDEILVSHVTEFEGKALKSVGKGDVELGSEEEKKAAEEARKEKAQAHKDLFEFIQKTLDEHIKEVRLSARLKDSAVCLVGDDQDMSPGMERLLRQANAMNMPKQKRILEINPGHGILTRMQAIFELTPEAPVLEDYAHLLHGQALIAEGSMPVDPVAFSKRVAELMLKD
ncbi:molecular chaperone HtpG [Myxococcota bacterium]|nr:molecular chaperone HtpG [Myxococcota bacterium]MBU1432615.1 molecular chaperone HtpG [Myxococcota bacterium]MBU1899522.1 molecular chaperone HtpG [Myxococcota bacterium]